MNIGLTKELEVKHVLIVLELVQAMLGMHGATEVY